MGPGNQRELFLTAERKDEMSMIGIKAYFPVCDRVQTTYIPAWLSNWPEWLPEEGLGL
jgi:hypothetical protein